MSKKCILKVLSILILILVIFSNIVYAEDKVIQTQKESLNINTFIKEAKKYSEEYFPDLQIDKMLTEAIKGNVDKSTLVKQVLNKFTKEIKTALKLLGIILAVTVISAIIRTISENLQNNTVSQVTYYVQYILIVTLVLSNFSEVITMAKETIQSLINFMYVLIPLLITLMISTGSVVSANLSQPIILFAISFISNMLSIFIIPLILVGTVLGVLSNISDKIQIGKLAKYFKTSIIWILGVVLTLFVGILSLEGTLSSSIDGITAKTAKAAVSSLIPVVGKILGDSIDTVLGSAVILKNAVGVVGIVVLLCICVVPVLKLTLLSVTYSVTSALCEPIADKKIVKLLEQFADTFKILLGIVCVVAAMFLIGVALVVKMSNSGIMYR